MKKRLLLGLSAIALFGGSLAIGITIKESLTPVNAEGESTSVVSSESTSSSTTSSTTATSEDKETWYKQIMEWVDNKVIPLLGGISIVSLLTGATSITTAISKHRGDKKNEIIIMNQDAQIAELKAKELEHQEYEEKMLQQFNVTLTETSKTMILVSNYAKATAELVATQNGQIKKVEAMKNAIDTSCTLIAKSLALTDVAVKSGIAQDAQNLVNNLKEVNKDGE